MFSGGMEIGQWHEMGDEGLDGNTEIGKTKNSSFFNVMVFLKFNQSYSTE